MELTNQSVQELNKMQLLFMNCGRWLERHGLEYNGDTCFEFTKHYDYDKDEIIDDDVNIRNIELRPMIENLNSFMMRYEGDEWYIYKDDKYISCDKDTLYGVLGLSEQELKDKLLKCDYINDKFTQLEIVINRDEIKEKLILGLF
ncbi:hypothetical protein DVV91_16735 [Clostridium botulinum]|uniref:hypothetical protein n=1 Tax=Clostridium botulinum TaxID=1491 RepID=UPI0019684858|nr:hypothetical protein [Clostridium botulinum]MBN1075969.1 hypothetical protein [Clostridium botulinum]